MVKKLKSQWKIELKQAKKDFTIQFDRNYSNNLKNYYSDHKRALNDFLQEFKANNQTYKELNKYTYSKQIVNFSTKKKHLFDFSNNPKIIRKRIGAVFQFAEYQLFKNTIKEDIAFGPIAFGMDKIKAYQKAEECLGLVGLGSEYLDRSPFELSGGQKRRVAIAGILAMDPDFMIFDEPTAGLDPVGVKEILEIISNLNKKGKTIINVTHDLDNVLHYAQRVLLLSEGELIKDSDPYDVLSDVVFLKQNNLQPPKLLEFVDKLRNKGIDVPKVLTEKQLAEFLNEYLKVKGVK
ncbi:ATP-binding cassette domain-containing protein [Mycoplasma nasistruthionis]|uniref:ATP-binding cassette domain-containing protein n=1 Tax=Mycoplasma nasistruthionis TaxID=353852 RepID=A0A4Y6I6N4_9MOLU|nr:ATP-binding cassette domain-containing protein [Mycoplasma nasistruthionis]